jgi:hypothetical protein
VWIVDVLNSSCPWIKELTEAELLLGYSESHANDKHLKIWKLFHAELIRVIWYSRCRKFFDDETLHIQALKGTIVYRCQTAFSIFEADPRTSKPSLAVWKKAFANSTTKNGRIRLNIVL